MSLKISIIVQQHIVETVTRCKLLHWLLCGVSLAYTCFVLEMYAELAVSSSFFAMCY